MSTSALSARTALAATDVVAVGLPGSNLNRLFAVVVTVALALTVAAMVYMAFVVGSRPGRVGPSHADSSEETDVHEADGDEDGRPAESA